MKFRKPYTSPRFLQDEPPPPPEEFCIPAANLLAEVAEETEAREIQAEPAGGAKSPLTLEDKWASDEWWVKERVLHREACFQTCRELDNTIRMSSRRFKCALVLSAFLMVGSDERRIQRLTRVGVRFTQYHSLVLRLNGVFTEDGCLCAEWPDPELNDGGVSFVLDWMVCNGELFRETRGGEHYYSHNPFFSEASYRFGNNRVSEDRRRTLARGGG